MKAFNIFPLASLLLALAFELPAQTSKLETWLTPSDTLSKKREKVLLYGMGAAIGATGIGLNYLWYKEEDRTSFHLINDNQGWLQVDKYGHAMSAYSGVNLVREGLLWTGMKHSKANNLAIIPPLLFMTGIELMDGHSTGWGFSWGDIWANTAGISFSYVQDLIWKEQRIWLKYSFNPKGYADYPEGIENRVEDEFGKYSYIRAFKDYNRQTYWASINLKSFIGKNSSLPDWLNLAVGYGGENMFGALGNVWTDPITGISYNYQKELGRYKQYYFSADIDLSRIKTKSKILKTALFMLNSIKVPLPTLEYNDLGNWKFHWLYF